MRAMLQAGAKYRGGLGRHLTWMWVAEESSGLQEEHCEILAREHYERPLSVKTRQPSVQFERALGCVQHSVERPAQSLASVRQTAVGMMSLSSIDSQSSYFTTSTGTITLHEMYGSLKIRRICTIKLIQFPPCSFLQNLSRSYNESVL